MRNVHRSPFVRAFLLFIGIISLFLGIVGIFVPLLPTTPFLLLASYSFARSNDKFNNWLLTNRFFGAHLHGYINRRTVKRQVKWATIGILWITIMVSVLVIHTPMFVKGLLVIIAIGVTIHLSTLKGTK